MDGLELTVLLASSMAAIAAGLRAALSFAISRRTSLKITIKTRDRGTIEVNASGLPPDQVVEHLLKILDSEPAEHNDGGEQ